MHSALEWGRIGKKDFTWQGNFLANTLYFTQTFMAEQVHGVLLEEEL
jgi:hypothetical protein